jgi:hypothetical protein
MKAINIKLFFILVAAFLVFVMPACKDDEIDVPMASTQANFEYEVAVVIIDEELEIEHYQVKLYNKSLLARSYYWDFGNGETSTEENPTVVYTSAGKYTIALTVTPTNDVYYNKLVKSESFAFGKQLLLFEDFNEGIEFIDEDSWAPEGWKAVDNDGDGYNWYVGVRQGVVSMRSQSWDGSPLEPDNWLITPEINLTGYDADASVTLRYGAGITANTAQYRHEHYGIFVAVGNDDLASFELVFEETFTTETPNWIIQEREIDLSAYAGNIIFVAIRHFNVTDMDRIFITEVELYVIE